MGKEMISVYTSEDKKKFVRKYAAFVDSNITKILNVWIDECVKQRIIEGRVPNELKDNDYYRSIMEELQ